MEVEVCTTRAYVYMYVLCAPTPGRGDVPGIRSFHCSARSGLAFCNAAQCRVLIEFGKFIDDNDYNIHIILIFHMSPNGLVSELISELIKES